MQLNTDYRALEAVGLPAPTFLTARVPAQISVLNTAEQSSLTEEAANVRPHRVVPLAENIGKRVLPDGFAISKVMLQLQLRQGRLLRSATTSRPNQFARS